jgi:ATP-binding cassette subfamily F protein 3
LPQESDTAFTGRSHSVYTEMQTVFSHLQTQEQQLRALEAAMAADHDESLLEKYAAAQARFEREGGYDYELRIRQVLTGLGFGPADWGMSLDHLSGGQKTRALLARLLLEKPDLLILDEPTNHLDVEAIEWLEGALATWDGAVLLVSHDRYFLDRVVTVIWEMSRSGMETYRGNYSAYVEQREARWERREKEYRTVRERLAKEMDYIRRNIAGQRTQMAKGKLSRISREVEALHGGGLDAVRGKSWAVIKDTVQMDRAHMDVAWVDQRIKSLPAPAHRPPQMRLRLEPAFRSGNIVLRTRDLQVGYPSAPLFETDDIELRRLECAALIGPNGAGKSTFLRTIMGDLPPLRGEIVPGASLQPGYFAQAHETLNPERTVLDELLNRWPMPISEGRSYLGRFLFSGDDVFQKIHTLSGGERGRLSLALLALEKANFLLLDEPTNHLDIVAQETLEQALQAFDGTVLLVTHDRYLVNRLATQIWHLRDGRLDVFRGSYQEYLAARAQVGAPQEAPAVIDVDATGDDPAAPQLSKNEQRRRHDALAAAEARIHQAEEQLTRVAHALQQASANQDFDKIQTLSIEYEAAQRTVDRLLAEWEKLASE